MPRSWRAKLVFVVITVLFTFLSVEVAAVINKRLSVRHWRVVSGLITNVEPVENNKYSAIKFQYSVDGVVFNNNQIGLGQKQFMDTTARAVRDLRSIKENATPVRVMVHPKDDRNSFFDYQPNDYMFAGSVLLFPVSLLTLFLLSVIKNRERY